MQDYLTTAVAARHADLRKSASSRGARRAVRIIDLDAPRSTSAPAARAAAKELTVACTR